MATKTFKGRIQNKHDTEANWSVATNFKPLAGELIIYDEDNAHSTPRFKVGDGSTLVSDLPFVSADFAKLNEGNTFTSKNYFDYKIYLGTPEDNVAELSFKDYTTDYPTPENAYIRTVIQAGAEYNGRPTIDFVNTEGGSNHDMIALTKWDKPNEHYYRTALENSVSSNPGNTGRHAAAIAHYELDGDTGAPTNQYRATFPFKSGTVALISDIPDTSSFVKLSTDNTFTGTNTFKTETSGSLYRTLINQNGVSVGGGPGNIAIDVTYGFDNIKRLYGSNTYTYTFPNKSSILATVDDIPNVLSLAKLAQDNTFTGNNTFTGDFSRKTRDSSGVIYYKESISDQGFTVGVGATEAATDTQAIYGYGSIKVTAGAAGTGTLSLPVKTGTLALTSDISAVKTGFFPIGYIYITKSSTSPAGTFGGTWERIKDKFLLAAGGTYTAGSTGGSADAVVVSHDHIEYGTNSGGAEDYRMAYKSETGTDYGIYYEPDGATVGSKGVFVRTLSAGVDGTGKNMPPYLTVYMWRRVA